LRPAALPIRMLGGSPTRVATPPMLEASACEIRKGTAEIPIRAAIAMTTGAISTIVVTLSNTAEAAAVVNESNSIARSGRPPAISSTCIPIHSNTPVRLTTATIIIMPARRNTTLRSMAANACSWSRTPAMIMTVAPTRAAAVRLTRSLIIAA